MFFVLFLGHPVLCADQGKYASQNKNTSKLVNPKRNERGVNQLSIIGCFNCGDHSHISKDFPKEVKLMRAAKSRLEYVERKIRTKRNAHTVLFLHCVKS